MSIDIRRLVGSHQGLALSFIALVIATATVSRAGQLVPDVQRDPPDAGLATAVLDTDGKADIADGMPLFARQTPPVLRPDHTGQVQVEILYAGDVSHLRVFYFRGSGYVFDEFPRLATGILGGRTVSVFRPSWAMGDFLLRFGLIVSFDSGGGAVLYIAPSTVPLGTSGFPTASDSVSMRTLSRTVGSVPIVPIDASAQYSSHVVNLVLPGLADSLGVSDSFSLIDAAQRFYSYFGDDYEQLAFVFREQPFSRRYSAYHSTVKNQISGIGLSLFDASVSHRSAGRLEGIDVYLSGLSNAISNHELSHQWGHFFDWQAITGITRSDTSHTPVWGHYESPIPTHISPNLRLLPATSTDWQAAQAPEPTQIPPLQAYAMGRLPANAVPPVDVFENQNPSFIFRPGSIVNGATRRATIDQIVAHHGPRTGPTVTAVRRATILVSRDALATPEEMAYWTLGAQRLEDPHQTGMMNESGIGSFRAISGVTLTTRLLLPGGQTLAGHAVLEPAILDVQDLAGILLDASPRLDVPVNGVFRMQGRIVDPRFAGATSIRVSHGEGIANLPASSIAPDGSFSILGSPQKPPGRVTQRVFLTIGNVTTVIASLSNVRLFDEVRVPPPPVALTATTSGGSASINWAPDTGSVPTSYLLDVGTSPGASNIGSFSTAVPSLSASAVPNGQYYLRARAVNSAGISAPSAEAVLTVGCAPPQPPAMLTGVVNGTSVTLAWQPSPTGGVTYVIVAGSTSGASNIAQVPLGGATSLRATVPAGRYFVRARAVTACGAGDSNEVELVVESAQLPGPPGGLTHQVTAGTVSLLWHAAAGTVGGYVLEAGSQTSASNLAVVPVGNVLSFAAAGVPVGTYYVRVRAFNAAGQGPPSNEVVVIVP